MTGLWPEEESPSSRLGGVFDEATSASKTGQQVVDELLEVAAALRGAGQPVPRAAERLEEHRALEEFLSPQPACSWLRNQRPLKGRGAKEIVEHWRVCTTCQRAARHERQARLRPEPQNG